MALAHVMRPITTASGNLLYGATVTVNETTFSIPIAQQMYADEAGTVPLSNPFTADSGVLDFWLPNPQRVSVLVQSPGQPDTLIYLDAVPPPEQTVVSTTPLTITNSPQPGDVLLAGAAADQAEWGVPSVSGGLTPLVTVLSQDFQLAEDPPGWGFLQQPTTTRAYDTSSVPPNAGFTTVLHATMTGAAGGLMVTSGAFTLLAEGYLALWLSTAIGDGDQVTTSVTNADSVTTVLDTVVNSRGWGYYLYPLAAGTYQGFTLQYSGGSAWVPADEHQVRWTGITVVYGGQVPAHQHPGAGASTVALGTGAAAASTGSTAVGVGVVASGAGATGMGYQAQAWGTNSVSVGSQASAPGNGSVAVGYGAHGNATAANWTSLGESAYCDTASSVALGAGAGAYGASSTALGSGSYTGAMAASGVAVGSGAQALGPFSAAIGPGAATGTAHTGSVALGSGAATTAAHQTAVGSATVPSTTVVAGKLYALGAVVLGTDPTSRVGFYGSEGSSQPTVTGSLGGNIVLGNIIAALTGMGLISNGTTA